ncbi:hypothetical protein JOY44_15840 [Phormidium sp. CLA17]|uniref:hypothetical protein n=1 Tax=Leptolyngbya sp. Cla-17 TaxID=2803751 RepID=UPI001492AE5E|nr:hypothetical protein [Leptolyngbya sp. Cla-17]MBM0743060.1 hypothetical protein [Leptolyngbya sp. Cla-17]
MVEVAEKRSKTVAVKQASIGNTSAFLQSLPEKPKEDLSLREAIDQLREPLRAALSRGYTYFELAEMLTEKGIKISAFTLKNYVPSGKRRANKEKEAAAKVGTRRGRKNQAVESAGAELEAQPSKLAETSAKESMSEAKKTESETGEKAPQAKKASAAKTKADDESTVKQSSTKSNTASAKKPASTQSRKKPSA